MMRIFFGGAALGDGRLGLGGWGISGGFYSRFRPGGGRDGCLATSFPARTITYHLLLGPSTRTHPPRPSHPSI